MRPPLIWSSKYKFLAIFLVVADNLHTFVHEMTNTTEYIMGYAKQNQIFCIADLMRMMPENNATSLSSIKSTITRLIKSERLVRIRRGTYSLMPAIKNKLDIVIEEKEKIVNDLLKEKFPFATFCIYNGKTLAPLQHHLSFNNATYIETERTVMEAAFSYLRDNGYTVFLNPKADIVSTYIDLKTAPIIIKPLITESPTAEQSGMVVPTLEKILVDIQKDADFSYLHGTEGDNMIANADSLYMINYSRLYRYGRRRGLNLK